MPLEKKIIRLKPIGRVRTRFDREEIRAKRSDIVSKVIVDPKYAKALDGIESYSHLFIIFYMDEVPLHETRLLKIHPRGRTDVEEVGVFATRSRNHPNRIGLAVIELLGRKGNVLKIKALDALDGTPVLDIKPYDHIDVKKNIRLPRWWYKIRQHK
jgi:tRNA-Thr(GGU) m(6)t(6)A37 methyltransferase TsaA